MTRTTDRDRPAAGEGLVTAHERPGGAERYRWRGTGRRGASQAGVSTLTRGQLAAFVAARHAAGWRDLVVCRGDGPVPPGAGEDSVAETGRHPGTGRRTWWAGI